MSARTVQVHGQGRHDPRALSRRGAGLHRPDRGTRRHAASRSWRRACRSSRSGQLRALGVTTAKRGSRPRRTCRPSPRPACPATTPRPGSPSSCRPRPRRRSSRRCTPTPSRCWPSPAIKARLDAARRRSSSARRPRRSATHLKDEMDKWGPVIKAANIKVNE